MSANITLRRQGKEAELAKVKKKLKNKCTLCGMTGHYPVNCPLLELRRPNENRFLGFEGFPGAVEGATEFQPVYGTDSESESGADNRSEAADQPREGLNRPVGESISTRGRAKDSGVKSPKPRNVAVKEDKPKESHKLKGWMGWRVGSLKIEIEGALAGFLVFVLGIAVGMQYGRTNHSGFDSPDLISGVGKPATATSDGLTEPLQLVGTYY
ncbi:hypothetical protein BKA70DRAFT_1431519 [Coprinopsis sp. MPI-PUGE-AT-0042]|nr:hypothetical protein BKA70DRAFT_1431519 [Coprinopsis sp. MPI-PUGE-AT-0042]